VLFIVSPPLLDSLPMEAELEPVDFPVPVSSTTACATAPARGNANKPAVRSIERVIEIIAVFLSQTKPHAKLGESLDKRRELLTVLDPATPHTQNRQKPSALTATLIPKGFLY
jgi:hypothetical protein